MSDDNSADENVPPNTTDVRDPETVTIYDQLSRIWRCKTFVGRDIAPSSSFVPMRTSFARDDERYAMLQRYNMYHDGTMYRSRIRDMYSPPTRSGRFKMPFRVDTGLSLRNVPVRQSPG